MKTGKVVLSIFFILSFISMQIFAQDTYNLKYKFEKGKTFSYRILSSTSQKVTAMGQEVNTSIDAKAKMKLETAEVSAAGNEIIAAFDSFYTKTSIDITGAENIDNGAEIIGKRMKIIYDQYGKKIKKVEIDKIKSNQNQEFSKNTNIFIQLPEKPVKAGETWTNSNTDTTASDEANKMITKTDVEYKLEGREKYLGADCLKISFKGTLKIEGVAVQQNMNIVMEGTGKVAGVYFFNENKGTIIFIENIADVDVNAAIPDQGMTIPISNKSKSTVFLVD